MSPRRKMPSLLDAAIDRVLEELRVVCGDALADAVANRLRGQFRAQHIVAPRPARQHRRTT